MLGYVTIEKNELKVREFEMYQAYYCGICKSIGRRFGQLPRMVLSYDSVFLALVLAGLAAEGESFVTGQHFIERGYENICRDFRELGARITSV